MNDCNHCEEGVVTSPAYNKASSCDNPPTQLTTIVIPKEKGGDGEHDPYKPILGAERNKIVVYEATGSAYIYDVNGVFTNLTGQSLAKVIDQLQQQLVSLTERVDGVSDYLAQETTDREAAVADLQASIKALQAALVQEASTRETEDTSLAQQIANLAGFNGDISEALAGKQDTLVSGTNIKTVNGESLLGSGNLDIGGGGGTDAEIYTQYASKETSSIQKANGTPLIQTKIQPLGWNVATHGSLPFTFDVSYGDKIPCINVSAEISETVRTKLTGAVGIEVDAVNVTADRADIWYSFPALPTGVSAPEYVTLHMTAIGIDPRQTS